jgi:hypothetical protein
MDVEQNRRRRFETHHSIRLKDGRWAARAQRLLEASYAVCVDGLQQPLHECLSDFEHKLFKHAESAKLPKQQQDFLVSRLRVVHDRVAFEERFLLELAGAINEVDKATLKPEAPVNGRSRLSLQLLDQTEQEMVMSIERLGARGEMRHNSVLYELGYRLAVLIGAPPLDGRALPLGPYALTRAIHAASVVLELPLEHHLLLMQSFEDRLIQALAPIYDSINALLLEDGILPELRSIPVPRTVNARSGAVAPEPAAAPMEKGRQTPASSAPPSGSIEVLESLRELLSQRRSSGDGTANGQPAGRAASADELQMALGALQQHLVKVTDQASRELRSAQRLREELLTQLNLGKPAGAPPTQLSAEQGDTVDLVAMLFEQLGQQLHGSGNNAHALLGNMQLPVTRIAVAEPEFLEKRDHPARKLLDTVTAAAHDWLDGSDDESSRPLAAKLDQLVARANQEPPTAGLYTALLADIEHHLSLLTRKAQTAESRHLEAAKGRERLDQARQRASEYMAERFAQSPPRGLLRALLDRAWSDVLALTLLRHGEHSGAFEAQLAITDQLLGRLPIRDRDQLQVDVEVGLQQIGMHAEEAVQVAQRLLGLDDPDSNLDLPSNTDLALRLKQHQRLGESGTQEAPAPQIPQEASIDPRVLAMQQHLRDLPFGSWFEFIDPASQRMVRRKLVWHSPISGRCLLVTRRGQRGEEMNVAQLAHEIVAGRVNEVPTQREGMLDRAWRSLTGNLRQPAASTQKPRQESERP